MKPRPDGTTIIAAKSATPNKWRTKDGRIIAIADMEDTHLENTILMLERKGAISALKYFEAVRDDPFFDPKNGREEDVVTYMEAKLVNMSDSLIATYQALLRSREQRIDRGTWSPRREKGEGPPPRVRGRNNDDGP